MYEKKRPKFYVRNNNELEDTLNNFDRRFIDPNSTVSPDFNPKLTREEVLKEMRWILDQFNIDNDQVFLIREIRDKNEYIKDLIFNFDKTYLYKRFGASEGILTYELPILEEGETFWPRLVLDLKTLSNNYEGDIILAEYLPPGKWYITDIEI